MALGSTNPPFDSGELLLEELGPEAAPPPPSGAEGALLELLELGAGGALLELLELLELGAEGLLLELLLEPPPPPLFEELGGLLKGFLAMAEIPVPRHRAMATAERTEGLCISLIL